MKILIRSIVGILLLIAVFIIVDELRPSRAVRALPASASDAKEHYEDFGITGDFVRLVKAKMPEEELEGYARRVGASSRTDETIAREIPLWWSIQAPEWWDPRQLPRFYHGDGNSRVLVGWESGYVYFDASAW